MSYALRRSSAMLEARDPNSEPMSAPSLSKRSVVASRKRSVASGQCPKDVLSGTFEKLRRTASTNSLRRMSLRFARTSPRDRTGGSQEGAPPEDWNWRPIGDVASDVVRNAMVAARFPRTQ